jgi:endo-1,4-beta-D-glucanase Y
MCFTRNIGLLLLFYFISMSAFTQQEQKPFPQHVHYQEGVIKPNHIGQAQLDDTVRAFYNLWKARYIRNDCGPGQYYIWFEKQGGNKVCVSEGQGYGMVIVALMAGYDRSARELFDGLYAYYQAHPSGSSRLLMAWAQTRTFKDAGKSSATDGDLDIAYALLLADAQWGSNGRINYRQAAREMIAAIMKQEINPVNFSVLLSDAIEKDSPDYFDMRSSDFMPAHFRAFRKISADPGWEKVIDNNYALFSALQKKYSPDAGLLPDFILHIDKTAQPASGRYLESRYDGAYNYNACRVPWRIATDFICNGDEHAKKIAGKINHWIKETTGGDPDEISAGYSLDGDDLNGRHFEALSFIAPFAVSAMIDKNNQVWLNRLWDYIIHFPLDEFDYYDNTIKMINMIILSGNYWKPD